MTDFSSALRVTSSALRMQAQRLQLISQNIANIDTPGFRRKMAPVETAQDSGDVALGRTFLDQRALEKIYQPGHPLADASGHFDGSNVDLIMEIADAREAQRSYEANLKMFQQTRQMSSALNELLRR